jgi:hypothetical protein
LIIVLNINNLCVMHRNKRTVLAQVGVPLPYIGEPSPIERVSSGFGTGVFGGAQVSNGYERQFHRRPGEKARRLAPWRPALDA